VVCPSVGHHANLAIGASLAGGIGVLDLSFKKGQDRVQQRRRLQDLLQRTSGSNAVGVRCHAADLEDADGLFDLLEERPHQLVLYGDSPARLAAAAARYRRGGCYRILVEVTETHRFAAIAAPESGVDGVIVCGQECGGYSGTSSSFLLAQQLLAADCLPVYVKGVPGLNSAAACRAVGSAGVVLDHQLLLLPESPLPKSWQCLLEHARSQDFQQLGAHGKQPVGVFLHPRFKSVGLLKAASQKLEMDPQSEPNFQAAVRRTVGWGRPEEYVWPLGQTAGWARHTRERFRSIGHLVSDLLQQTEKQVGRAARLSPLAPDSPLAITHGTRYPVVQGPMTRVSDCPLFARAVADSGGLPMISLALARREKTAEILGQAKELLKEAPWGVGILGFVSPEIQQEQLAEVIKVKPPFALIAGGRPSQAKTLESEGIATYLHAPVPSLIPRFLQQGARRFVLEGRECGGHVGPLSSFVLWESAIEAVLSNLPPGEKVCVLFAGGIHDARSAAMVSALSVPLVEAGVEVGVLMGTAYLFTEQAVSTGAITQGFQDTALQCSGTVTLESAVGHANRCAETPFSQHFIDTKRRLLEEGCAPEVVRDELDNLLLGRLRQATRGVKRDQAGELIDISSEEQLSQGMYMMGEVAALRFRVLSMQQLHQEVSEEPHATYLKSFEVEELEQKEPAQACEVAIIGISLAVPGAAENSRFFRNLSDGRVALSELPSSRWDVGLYFDEDKQSLDGCYSRWGGWVDDFLFDPLKYGMPPNRWNSTNPNQIISLEMAHRALVDAGYNTRPFNRARTSTIVAAGDTGMLGSSLIARSFLKLLDESVSSSVLDRLPEWTADSFPGVLGSICSGRVANRLDLGGTNFVVDAACASSLTAVDMACHELMSHRSDQVLVGGVDIGQTPFDYTGFSRVQALSPTGTVRPFDQSADGIVLSEGSAFMVLKRLDDALRDGDRIYAVIRGVGTSSDGRTMGLTAPHSAGQKRALERAWNAAGLRPEKLEMYEAHATGTSLGDTTELETISSLLTDRGAFPRSCALGSVKSLVGHTKRAAGLVSLAKAAMSLHHKVLLPHSGVDEPLECLKSDSSPVCLYDKPQPWLKKGDSLRTAAVSAFGFGGTNAHVVLQEFPGAAPTDLGGQEWPAELILLGEDTGTLLAAQVDSLLLGLEDSDVRLRDVAFTLATQAADSPPPGLCAAMVVADLAELKTSLGVLRDHLRDNSTALPPHILLAQRSGVRAGKTALLFPGQGSQYVSCAREMVLYFQEFRQALESADLQLRDCYSRSLNELAYPPRALTKAQRAAQREQVTDTHLAQPLLGAVGWASYQLMKRLGFAIDSVAGHSYGEYTALCAAGTMDFETLVTLSESRGRAMASIKGEDCGGMAAVTACRSVVEEFLSAETSVVIANHNSLDQTVISGPNDELELVLTHLKDRDIRAVRLAVSGGFHSPIMRAAQKELTRTIRSVQLSSPTIPVYSNLNGEPYPANPGDVLEQLKIHLLGSVEFVAQVQSMGRDGTRTFVEMAPGSTLSSLVQSILPQDDVLAVSLDNRRAGFKGFLKSLGQLRCAGVRFTPVALFDDRDVSLVDLDALPQKGQPAPTSWLVNSSYVLPVSDTTPRLGKKPLRKRTDAPQESKRVTFPSPQAMPPQVMPSQVIPPQAVPPQTSPTVSFPVASNSPVPPSQTPGLEDGRVVQAYQAYQQTMQQFLRTQEQVMSSFLQALSPHTGVPAHFPPSAPPPQPVPPQPVLEPQQTISVEPEPAPEPEFEVAELTDIASIERELIKIVSKQTGYPAEMLVKDADLEADLGIDSIKRLEIMDDLASLLPEKIVESVRDATDGLIRLRTLQELAQGLAEMLAETVPEEELVLPARYLMKGTAMVARPGELTGHFVLIPDRNGIAEKVRAGLVARGCQVTLWDEERLPKADVSGVIHLAGLDSEEPSFELVALREQTERQVMSLFQLTQRLGQSSLAGASILVATRWGGRFGRDGTMGPGSLCAAGAAGFARSLATEWPDLSHTAVDFAADDSDEFVVSALLAELACGDAEVGYSGGKRFVFLPELAPLEVSSERFLPRDGVILATGGGRGITAEIVCGMAREGHKIVLLGRTELTPESPEVAGLQSSEELRGHFIKSHRGESPAQLERRLSDVLRQREIRETLSRLSQLGCKADYRTLDITDSEATARLLREVYKEFGRIDTVLHGAGVIEDKLLEDKSVESFQRVYRTKVEGLSHLLQGLKWDSLKNLVLFSSVAGRFGNRGQTDYAAANEVLNRWAWRLAGIHTGLRVVSVNWGPWDGLGMASSAHARVFLDRGIVPVDVAGGRACLPHELALQSKDQVEVVIGEGRWSEILEKTAHCEVKKVER
jgi:acyl transferase domain-containing protein/NAD(P)H-dependent flavin oxidoreductase YrpB (nitropropane dioxygenase family)/NAD(P)-dependent dehydrogenase (short-subunit alcohol dehydrogenase family)